MVKKYIIGTFAVLLLLQGCKSTNKQAIENSKYKRKPITEVSQDRLNNDVLLIEAKTQSELGNDEEAARIYHRLLKQDPNYAAAYYEMGGMFYVDGMMDSAAFYTEKAYNLSPKNVWYKLQLSDIYKKLQRIDEAAKVSEELVAEHPEVLEYYYELANVGMGAAYEEAGEYEKAMEYYKLGNDKSSYSACFAEVRDLWLREHFALLLGGVVLLLLGIVVALNLSEK